MPVCKLLKCLDLCIHESALTRIKYVFTRGLRQQVVKIIFFKKF